MQKLKEIISLSVTTSLVFMHKACFFIYTVKM